MILLLLAASACASRPKAPSTVVWPLPPDTPRIRFVRAFASEDDLGPSGWQQFARAVTGSAAGLSVVQPTGLALSVDEKRLYVANSSIGLVLEFNLETKEVRPVADEEGYRPQFPFGVAVDAHDVLYVSDSRRHSVMVYAQDGKFLREIGAKLLERPTGIAIDRGRDRLYVSDGSSKDSSHHVVEVFTTAGEHVRTVGSRGAGDGQFYFPAYLAVAPNGNLYVSDSMNFRIEVFDPDGRFVGKFGRQGNGIGDFARTKGLAFDAFGNLHVVDGEFAVVQVFNAAHQPLMFYGGRANKLEFFDMPTAIAIDSKNNIYVANYIYARINQYEMINTVADDSFREAPAQPPAPASDAAHPAAVEDVTVDAPPSP